MQGSFEKKVQQKMEELRFSPSAPVWEKIENEIRPESKKRRGLVWITFLGLLLVGSGWWAYSYLSHDDQPKATIKRSGAFVPSNDSEKTNEKNTAATQKNQNTISQPATGRDGQNERKNTAVSDLQKTTPVSHSGEMKKNDLTNIPELDSSTFYSKQKGKLTPHYPTTEDKEVMEVKKNVVTQSSTNEQVIVTFPDLLTQDSLKKTEVKQPEKLPSLNPDTTPVKHKMAISKKWQPRFVFSAGWASTTGNQAKSLLYNAAPLSSTSPAYGAPAPTIAGPGFSLGMLWSKQLNERWEFAVGLQYAHYATKATVGDKKIVDTTFYFRTDRVAVDEYYTNTARRSFTNRIGVIELPARLSYKLVKAVPLSFSVGVSYGRVISTNALSFSSPSNIYYKNKDNDVQQQLPLHTSLQYSFGGKKFKLHTGPFFQYNLLKLQKEYTGEAAHLMFAGLRTELSF